jgi:hypothetical protein
VLSSLDLPSFPSTEEIGSRREKATWGGDFL